MKINIIAIGKIKEKFFEDAIGEYAKRISKYAEINIIELPDAPQGKSPDEQKVIESARILEKAKGYVIAADGGGEELTSRGIADMIEKKMNEGVSEFSFLIGGSHGHDENLKKRANMLLSFGKPTYPHQLFRVMLTEQIYRSLTILAGTPYHK